MNDHHGSLGLPVRSAPSPSARGALITSSCVPEILRPSTELQFLLVVYVGAQWKQERERDTLRWQLGARALRSVLNQLARQAREVPPRTATSTNQNQFQRHGISRVPRESGGGNKGGAS